MAGNPQKKFRVNNQINVSQVRLFIDEQLVGVVSIEEARRRAFDLGLDLVETVPHAKPPVCKIVDFGKLKYDEKIRKKQEVKNQKSLASKEVRLRYCTDQHDLEVKVSAIKKFLEEKRRVRVVMRFKNRELMFKKQGEEVMQKVAAMIENFGTFVTPKLEGKSLIAQIDPK